MTKGTWESTNLLNDRKSVDCKWMFHTESDASSAIVKHTTRLVVKMYFQMAEMHFNNTFVPVIKFITIIYIPTIRVAMDCKIRQMNVKAVSLNGMLEVEIYMDQLEKLV